MPRPALPPLPHRRSNVLTPLERVGGLGGGPDRGHPAGSLAPLFANLGAVAGIRRPAAGAAAGGDASAGAADQPRSKPDRQRHQECVPEIRAFSRGVAGVRLGSVEPSGVPDLKAALIVLRQTLLSSLGRSPRLTLATPATVTPTATAPATATPATARNAAHPAVITAASGSPHPACAPRQRWLHRCRRRSTCRKSCCRRRGCRWPMISFSSTAPARIVLTGARSNAGLAR